MFTIISFFVSTQTPNVAFDFDDVEHLIVVISTLQIRNNEYLLPFSSLLIALVRKALQYYLWFSVESLIALNEGLVPHYMWNTSRRCNIGDCNEILKKDWRLEKRLVLEAHTLMICFPLRKRMLH